MLMSGRIGDNIFYYMDTEPLLGTIYEFVGHWSGFARVSEILNLIRATRAIT